MDVRITGSRLLKSKIEDYNEEIQQFLSICLVKICYDFITRSGINGYFVSPKYQYTTERWHFDRETVKEGIDISFTPFRNSWAGTPTLDMYLKILSPKPYKIESWEDDYEQEFDVPYYKEKKNFEFCYRNGDYLTVKFSDISLIPQDIDNLGTFKSFESWKQKIWIRLEHVYNIEQNEDNW